MNSNREHFKISRSSEYFDKKELQAQTGQAISNFGSVVLKELVDNALDACEMTGVDPEITLTFNQTDEVLTLCVADNGIGLNEAVIERILDFDTRTSDKAAYRSPSRGAQGNAFKTIIGIPHSLGGGRVIIESRGVRHEINATATPAGTVEIKHKKTPITAITGTSVIVEIPSIVVDVFQWGKRFAVFNPHVFVRIAGFEQPEISMLSADDKNSKSVIFYKSSDINKILPSDPTSAHWYEQRDFEKLTYLQATHHDMPLGEYVRQFKGLKSTGKAKKVCLPLNAKLVSDIYKEPEMIGLLLDGMKSESVTVKPKALGFIGEDNFLSRFSGIDRHWYKKVDGMINDVPYLFEILVAETDQPGGFYYGVNHSPTFEDFLGGTWLHHKDIDAYGMGGIARVAGINEERHIIIAHLVGIGLTFLDRGKTKLSLPDEMTGNISKAIWYSAKALYREHKAAEKDAAKAARDAIARRKSEKTKENSRVGSVLHVLPKAIALSTLPLEERGERLPSNVRNVYYKVRDMIQEYTSKELTYGYFSQNILIRYWQKCGRDPLIYNDPRGVMYEPHTGKTLVLGTMGVDKYIFPEYVYDKILYVEKKGLWPIIEASKLHLKYDMAVIAGEGYSSEAIRTLVGTAQGKHAMTVFVLHDADPDGYNIARTLREETRRMPNHNIDVVDLGLTVEAAIDMGLSHETFTRKKALPKQLSLNDIAQVYFEGERDRTHEKPTWICKRFELNAMSSRQLINHIDKGIQASGFSGKVIPPEQRITSNSETSMQSAVGCMVDNYIAELLDTESIKEKLIQGLQTAGKLKDIATLKDVIRMLHVDINISWETAVERCASKRLNEIKACHVDKTIRMLIKDQINKVA